MVDSAKKAKETRERNQEARAAKWAAEAALKQAAKTALQRVFEDKNATSEQILEAAKLLVEIGRY